MHSISSTASESNVYLAALAAQRANQSAGKPSSAGAAQTSASQPDSFQLSPSGRDLLQTGRIALNEKAGTITSDQATQLYAQVSAAQKQITADKAANGGTLNAADVQSLETVETQTGQQIYGNAHNGAAPPPTAPQASSSAIRNLAEYARIGLNENAGNLTAGQASTLDSQIQTTYQQIVADQQSNGGPLTLSQAAAINQSQTQLSAEIHSLSSASAT